MASGTDTIAAKWFANSWSKQRVWGMEWRKAWKLYRKNRDETETKRNKQICAYRFMESERTKYTLMKLNDIQRTAMEASTEKLNEQQKCKWRKNWQKPSEWPMSVYWVLKIWYSRWRRPKLLRHWGITIGVKGAAKDEFSSYNELILSDSISPINKLSCYCVFPLAYLPQNRAKSRRTTSNGKIYCLSMRKSTVNISIKCLPSLWPTSRLRH